MKITTAYYLLLLYTVAFLKPALPVIKDFLAHSFTLNNHIETIHYQNGKYHVHKEIVENIANDKQDRNTADSKYSEPVSIHIISDVIQHFRFQLITKHNYNYSIQTLPYPLKYIITPPPKFFNSLS